MPVSKNSVSFGAMRVGLLNEWLQVCPGKHTGTLCGVIPRLGRGRSRCASSFSASFHMTQLHSANVRYVHRSLCTAWLSVKMAVLSHISILAYAIGATETRGSCSPAL